jgi:hypothetical protein
MKPQWAEGDAIEEAARPGALGTAVAFMAPFHFRRRYGMVYLTMAGSSGSCELAVQPAHAMTVLSAEDPAHDPNIPYANSPGRVQTKKTGRLNRPACRLVQPDIPSLF